jgi:predicted MFS family arabinose efflux permease
LVSRWFDQKRPLATGIAVSGAGVGIFCFAPFLRLLIDIYGGEGALLIEGALAMQGCVFALLLRPIPNENSTKRSRTSSAGDQTMQIRGLDDESAPLKAKPLKNSDEVVGLAPTDTDYTMKTVLTSWIFWVFAFSQFFTFVSSMGPLVFLYNRAIKDLGIDPMQASYVLSMLGVANTAGRLIFGALANKFPGSSMYLLSGAVMIYGIATAVSVLGTSFWTISLFAVVFGAGYGKYFIFRFGS